MLFTKSFSVCSQGVKIQVHRLLKIGVCKCVFSPVRGLKDLITPLIAGLLEVNTGKAWKFDRFFREVKRITEMKVIYTITL